MPWVSPRRLVRQVGSHIPRLPHLFGVLAVLRVCAGLGILTEPPGRRSLTIGMQDLAAIAHRRGPYWRKESEHVGE